jgi:hypothetical protein
MSSAVQSHVEAVHRPVALDDWTIRFLTLWIFLFALFALRRPDALRNPQFWAEDGSLLFAGHLTHPGIGWLFHPYRGYLIVNTKLLAALGSLMPAVHVPVAFNLMAICVASLACSLFCLSWYRFLIRSDLLRLAICVGMAGAVYSESLVDTLNNSQWYIGIIALLLLFRDPTVEYARWQSAASVLAAMLAALSNPVLVITVPICVWQIIKRKNNAIAITLLIGICIQIGVFFLSSPVTTQPLIPKPHILELARSVLIATIYKVVINSVAGWKNGLAISDSGAAWIFYLVLTGTSAWLSWLFFSLNPGKRVQALLAAYLVGASVVLAMRGRGLFVAFQTPTHLTERRGEQYFFIGGCVFLFLIGLTVERVFANQRGSVQAVAAWLAIAGGFYGNFRASGFNDFTWPAHAKDVAEWREAAQADALWPGLSIPENPAGWAFQLPPTFSIRDIRGFPDHLVADALSSNAKPFPLRWGVNASRDMQYLNLSALFTPHTIYQIRAFVRSDVPTIVSMLVHGDVSDHNVVSTPVVSVANYGQLSAVIDTASSEDLCIHLIRHSGGQPRFDSIKFEMHRAAEQGRTSE